MVEAGSGRYLPPATLDALAGDEGSGDDPVITYCGGGIAASMTAFAFALAVRKDVRVYDGSLAEWTADPDRPVVRD